MNWCQSRNCSKAQPDPGQPVGDHTWGEGRWKNPSPLRARVWVHNWEGSGSREEQEPFAGGCLRGGCTAGQLQLGRTSRAEAPEQSSGHVTEEHKRCPWAGKFVPDGQQFFPLSPGCSCSSSNGCDLCRLFSVLTEP